MDKAQVRSALKAARAIASDLGLGAGDAAVLSNSNRLAVRLLPCDVLVRVAPLSHQANSAFEVEVARRLAEADSPVAEPDPRVEPRAYVRGGFAVTFWVYYEPLPEEIAPAEFARALEQLHAGMREVEYPSPHFTDRIEEAQQLVSHPELTPELSDPDRDFLGAALRGLRSAIIRRAGPEQLLHGEPHAGNLLSTGRGPLFIDLQTCCRGPVEFDIAHAPEAVSAHYGAADQGLVALCRALVLAMVSAWRWDREDQFPGGRRMGIELLSQLRAVAPEGEWM